MVRKIDSSSNLFPCDLIAAIQSKNDLQHENMKEFFE